MGAVEEEVVGNSGTGVAACACAELVGLGAVEVGVVVGNIDACDADVDVLVKDNAATGNAPAAEALRAVTVVSTEVWVVCGVAVGADECDVCGGSVVVAPFTVLEIAVNM